MSSTALFVHRLDTQIKSNLSLITSVTEFYWFH